MQRLKASIPSLTLKPDSFRNFANIFSFGLSCGIASSFSHFSTFLFSQFSILKKDWRQSCFFRFIPAFFRLCLNCS